MYVCMRTRVYVSAHARVTAKAVHPSGSSPASAAHLGKILEGLLAHAYSDFRLRVAPWPV